MHEAFVNVNGIPTQVMTWGPWIEETFPQKEVVLCITGNPGLPGFYTKFLSTVHQSIDASIPVWIIGHAGHTEPRQKNILNLPQIEGNESKYNLNGQIQHKAEFIRKYIPDDVKIHLIAHSIGAYITVELLKDPEINRKMKRCYLLFPTIERMAESPNGKYYNNYIRRFWFLLRFFIILFAMLPQLIQTFLIGVYFYLKSYPNYFVGTVRKFLQPNALDMVILLANDEMDLVRTADIDTIKTNQNIIKLHYGASDGWTPLNYYRDIKEKMPDLDAEINTMSIPHTFVLTCSEEMGNLVGEWIGQYKN